MFCLLHRENGVCGLLNDPVCAHLIDAYTAISGGGRAQDVTHGESFI